MNRRLPFFPWDLSLLLIMGAIVIAAFLLFIVLSCGGNNPAPNTTKSGEIGNDIHIYRTEPAQGITCIVADGYQSVAIDCDWGRP